MIYFQLFKTFLLIGAFSFGGGLASMELIRSRVVAQGWMSNAEFTDIISIAEMTPGPLGINIASFVGIRTAGILGTVIATFAYALPAILIVMLLANIYYKYRTIGGIQGILKGLRPAIAGMVFASAVKLTGHAWWDSLEKISLHKTNLIAVILTLCMLYLLQTKKIGPVRAIILSGVIGAVCYAIAG